MKRDVKWIVCLIAAMVVLSAFVASPAYSQGAATDQAKAAAVEKPNTLGSDLGLKGKLGAAISKAPAGEGKGEINVNAPKGAFGIPGAPQINYVLAILWAVWVGWIFSTVGAFGGIMAGVGHMSIYGLGDYAKGFKDTVPELNKTLTDSIRTSNQFLVGLSALISTMNYLKSKRVAWPLGIALGLGSIAGAIFIPMLTGGKISFRQYQGWFGVFVFAYEKVSQEKKHPHWQKNALFLLTVSGLGGRNHLRF